MEDHSSRDADSMPDDFALHGFLGHRDAAFPGRPVFAAAQWSHGQSAVSILGRVARSCALTSRQRPQRWFSTDHFPGFPVPAPLAACTTMGTAFAILAYGRGRYRLSSARDARSDDADGLVFQERQMDLVEVLSFLFMLSTMELGRVSPRFSRSVPAGLHIPRNTPSNT